MTASRSHTWRTTAKVMADEHDGHAEAPAHVVEQLEDLSLHRDVQGRGRLVAQQDLGLGGQRQGDEDALAHAARELVRESMRPPFGVRHPHQAQQLHGASPAGPARRPEHPPGHLGHLRANGVHGVEAAERILEDHRQPAPAGPPGGRAGERERLSRQFDDASFGPYARGQQAHQRSQGQALARAGLSDHAQGAAGRDLETDVPNGHVAPRPRPTLTVRSDTLSTGTLSTGALSTGPVIAGRSWAVPVIAGVGRPPARRRAAKAPGR